MIRTQFHWWRIALIAALAFVISYVGYRSALHRRVETKLAEIRRQGCPATLADFETYPIATPQAGGFTNLYWQAFAQIKKPTEQQKKDLPIVGEDCHTPAPSELLPEEMKAAMTTYLQSNTTALRLLTKADPNTNYRFPYDLTNPESTIKSQLAVLSLARQAARLLAVQTLLTSANGDAASASQAVIASVSLAESLSDRPLLITYLVQEAVLQLAIGNLQQALNRTAFTDSQLTAIAAAFEKIELTGRLKLALIGERAWNNSTWNELRRAGCPQDAVYEFENLTRLQQWMFHVYRPAGIVVDLDYLAELDMDRQLLDLSDQPESTRGQRAKLIIQKFKNRWDCPSTGLTADVLANSFTLDAKSTARLRTVRAALAILQQKPVKFLDPFTGQPLGYKKLEKGFVVYSVGADGKDDGGDENKDITFVVEH